ncbi:uncharacterized protein LOC110029409 [Phalaenopsis equestris]|uniref:uncharacterized protein LOC110029409 n=1 Tax=Phalaenopsis equestris TaxID=78828 RepID=UPI0009E4A668|nr:uncharacterized protein LOC110029409 [Phalaenopsis equestris]
MMLQIAAMVAITVLLLTGAVIDTAAEMPEASSLCVSKCGTCPVICSPPPSPPKPSSGAILTPPAEKPPPSPTSSFSSSPASGEDQGSLSYPYYYFYTADAARAQGLFHGIMGLFLLLVLSFWML